MILDLLVDLEVATSRSEARRLLAQNGVRVDGETVVDEQFTFKGGEMIQVGKRRFFKLTTK